MPRKLGEREWVEKYKFAIQNEELISVINLPDLSTTSLGAWSFLKLACLWSFAYYTYTPIIGPRYQNICYVDLFSGSGLVSFEDSSKNTQLLIGSPILMATLAGEHPFSKCFFFEKETGNVLEKRLKLLNIRGKLTCKDYRVFSEDCNVAIDELMNELRSLQGAHFLLFVDPFSTEIHWATMEKLLSLRYPAFDMIFNFQPFGINRMSYQPKTLSAFFGDDGYKEYLEVAEEESKLDALRNYYVQKLKKFKEKIKTIETIRVSSGKGGFYYDLIYTTRKERPSWIEGIKHLGKMVGKMTGADVSIMFDKKQPSLDKFKEGY